MSSLMKTNLMDPFTTERIFNQGIKVERRNLSFQFCEMKLSITLATAIIALVLFSCKTDNRQVTADMINFPKSGTEDNDLPVISFDSLECHFGKIAIGEKYTHIYRFTNTGTTPLVIAQVTPSCGCTTPKDWPHEPVGPGESGQITIEFNSKGFPGKVEKSISVLTNCLPKVWELKLIGEVSGVDVPTEEKKPGFEMERQ